MFVNSAKSKVDRVCILNKFVLKWLIYCNYKVINKKNYNCVYIHMLTFSNAVVPYRIE